MILVTFFSVSSALYLESVLGEAGTACRVIPVPRALSSSCGYAAEVGGEDGAALRTLCDAQGIEWEAMYLAQDGAYTPLFDAGSDGA